jgi:hypothetical protein
MKTNPTRENAAMLTKRADNGAPADSRPHPQIAPKPGRSDQFSHMNSVSITKAEILRTAEAIKQAGCRDVLIIYTPEFVRFIVTTNLPKSR